MKTASGESFCNGSTGFYKLSADFTKDDPKTNYSVTHIQFGEEINSQNVEEKCTNMYESFNKVSVLDVQSHNLSFLSHVMFTNLTEVILKNNKIISLSSDPFKNTRNLKKICLANNNLNTLLTNTFANLMELEELHLENNKITKIDDGSFKNLHNLIVLWLQSNAYNNINESIFCNNKKLIDLKIDYKMYTTLNYSGIENANNDLLTKIAKYATEQINFNIGQILRNKNSITDMKVEIAKSYSGSEIDKQPLQSQKLIQDENNTSWWMWTVIIVQFFLLIIASIILFKSHGTKLYKVFCLNSKDGIYMKVRKSSTPSKKEEIELDLNLTLPLYAAEQNKDKVRSASVDNQMNLPRSNLFEQKAFENIYEETLNEGNVNETYFGTNQHSVEIHEQLERNVLEFGDGTYAEIL